jgi:hypothetical protein
MKKIQFKVAKQANGYAVVLNDIVEAECQTKQEAKELANTWNIANRWTNDDWAARKNAEELGII